MNGTAHRHEQRRVDGVTPPNSSSPAARNLDSKRVLPRHPAAAAVVAAGFAVLLYLIEIVDSAVTADLDEGGIEPRSLGGLEGIIWSPLLHHGWAHLIGNTIPVVVFAFLVMAAGLARWFLVTGIVWILGGLGVWLTAPSNSITVGASGLAFGWLAFLLVRGIFTRSAAQLAVAALLLVLWGGMLWGALPGAQGVSWQAHLFGALAGVFAAWVLARADRRRVRQPARDTATRRPGNLDV